MAKVTSICRNRTAERAIPKRVADLMAGIADQAFSDAFNQMCAVSAKEGSPRTVGTFTRWYLRSMRTCLEDRERTAEKSIGLLMRVRA
jgi:hypothetical protein